MKKSILLLFIIQICYSQKYHNDTASRFSVKTNVIYWENTFECDSTKAANFFKDNLKFPNQNKGIVNTQKIHCPGVSMYLYNNFRFNYIIKYHQNSYTVTVAEIIFDDNIQLGFGNVTTSNNSNRIEEFELKNKDGTMRKNQQSSKNLECLDSYFINTFSIN